jgi:hypothetical protein
MTLHPSNTFLCKDLKPEDRLNDDQVDIIRSDVLYNIGRTLAFAVCGYADWLCYFCMKYLEDGGNDDLEDIRKYIVFPNDISWELENKIINDIYSIIREIRVTQDEYENVPPRKFENFNVGKAIDFMLEHCKDVRWDVLSRSIKIMEEQPSKEDILYTKQLIQLAKKGFDL